MYNHAQKLRNYPYHLHSLLIMTNMFNTLMFFDIYEWQNVSNPFLFQYGGVEIVVTKLGNASPGEVTGENFRNNVR